MTAAPLRGRIEVATFGETMAALRADDPIRLGGTMRLSVAGAESNVAIGLARLGHRVGWTGRWGTTRPANSCCAPCAPRRST